MANKMLFCPYAKVNASSSSSNHIETLELLMEMELECDCTVSHTHRHAHTQAFARFLFPFLLFAFLLFPHLVVIHIIHLIFTKQMRYSMLNARLIHICITEMDKGVRQFSWRNFVHRGNTCSLVRLSESFADV